MSDVISSNHLGRSGCNVSSQMVQELLNRINQMSYRKNSTFECGPVFLMAATWVGRDLAATLAGIYEKTDREVGFRL